MKKVVGQYVVKNDDGTTFLTVNIIRIELGPRGIVRYYTEEDTKYSLLPSNYPIGDTFSLSSPARNIPQLVSNLLFEVPKLKKGLGL